MKLKVGNLVKYTEHNGFDIGYVTYVDIDNKQVKIVWFDYESKEYKYNIDNLMFNRVEIVA